MASSGVPNPIELDGGARRLTAAEVRWTCGPADLPFQSTAELTPPDALIGQERAERSIEFGVDIRSRGFNIYAAGIPGTGRTSMIMARLQAEAARQPTPDDWCYVHNFDDSHRPRALRVPAGQAPTFRARLRDVVETLRHELQRAFDTEEYQNQRDAVTQAVQTERRDAFSEFEQRASTSGFAVTQLPAGLNVSPIQDGQPMSPEALRALPESERQRLHAIGRELDERLGRLMRRLRRRQRAARSTLSNLSSDVARGVARPLLDDVREEYEELPHVTAHLDAMESHITRHHENFLESDSTALPAQRTGPAPDPYLPYRVNVLVTHQPGTGAPLVRDTHPTHPHLFGRVETRTELGVSTTDFTLIQPGALHRANGGYLVLDANDLLQSGTSYAALKRALRNERVRIESAAEEFGLPLAARLEPQPIPLDLKVALVGPPDVYALLYELDPDFGQLFKVLAEFETEIELNAENTTRYAQFIAARCAEKNLRHFDRSAVARIVEEGVRLAGDRTKLSTRFGDISDIVREAEYWARRRGGALVTEEDVWSSIDERIRRSNRLETQIRDRMADGTVMIDAVGSAVGQVNGLTVIGVGSHEFGQPNRITARVFAGRDGVVSIDREAKLSGPIHDKGAMILAGFLNGTFGLDGPLTMSASIAFEQSYWGVEGDSASLAELLALLSALSDYPLDQGMAVTGSVNQHGRVQAVGGVTQKIEGFYDLCASQRLSGRQGVLIPASNVRNLTLRWDVAGAVADGTFHIHAAGSVAEAVELLTGRSAGAQDAMGRFSPDSVFGAAQARLNQFARRWHDGPAH
ncbi:MAG: AAA family ATPase [Chloroflexi bacterium]|nr:AAA family ATPase [Chloroflexota bacterium]